MTDQANDQYPHIPHIPHILHVRLQEPGIVDDYGVEVGCPIYKLWVDCPYGDSTGTECQCVEECDCVHPDDDERFADFNDIPWPEQKDHPLWDAFAQAESAYEDAHPMHGWHATKRCWAASALPDWDPEYSDEAWRILYPGDWPVKVSAEDWAYPDEAILVLEAA